MSWAEVKKINSDFTKPLNELINEKIDYMSAMTDLKLFGEESYAFNDEELFRHLIYDTPYAVNDINYNSEILNYLVQNSMHVGNYIANAYGIPSTIDWSQYPTSDSIINDKVALGAVIGSAVAINLLLGSIEVLEGNKDFILNTKEVIDSVFSSNSTSVLLLSSDTLRAGVYDSEIATESLFSHTTSSGVLLGNYHNEVVTNENLMNNLFNHKESILSLKQVSSSIFTSIKASSYYRTALNNSKFKKVTQFIGSFYDGPSGSTHPYNSKFIQTIKDKDYYLIGYSQSISNKETSEVSYWDSNNQLTYYYSPSVMYCFDGAWVKGAGGGYKTINNSGSIGGGNPNRTALTSSYGTNGDKVLFDKFCKNFSVVPYAYVEMPSDKYSGKEISDGTVYVSYLDYND